MYLYGKIKLGVKDESGKAKPDIFPIISILGIALMVMAFIQNAGAEVIGGIVGGLVVLFATGFWYKFRTFELRYINPQEDIKPEKMQRFTAVRMDVGEYVARIIIRPRKGMTLNAMGIAFFDPSWLPWKAGERRSNKDILASEFSYLDINGNWISPELQKTEHYTYVKLPDLRLASHSQRVFEIVIKASNAVQSWQGVLGFQMHYTLGGDPDRKNVNTKCIVCSPENRRPLRAVGKRIFHLPSKGEVER